MYLPPLSSYAAVMYAALLHGIEAVILYMAYDADGSVGLHALLYVIPNRTLLINIMVISSIMAIYVIGMGRKLCGSGVVLLLVPQQLLLIITAIGAWIAVWQGSYADGVLRSSLFITADQLPRGMFSLIHFTALYALSQYCRRPGRERTAAGPEPCVAFRSKGI